MAVPQQTTPPPQVYVNHGGRADWNQQRFKYNEYIVSAKHWNDRLPHTIQAVYFYCDDDYAEEQAREKRTELLRAFSLDGSVVPLVCINSWNWDAPFELRSA